MNPRRYDLLGDQYPAFHSCTSVTSPNTPTMPPKRRAINVDNDEDADIIEIIQPPPKQPRVMPPTLSPAPARPVQAVAEQGYPIQFFQLGVVTNDQYTRFFPDRPLKTLAALRKAEMQTVMQAYQTNNPIPSTYTYTIIHSTAVSSTTDFNNEQVEPSTPSLSYANARLLQIFLKLNTRLAAMKERPRFIMLSAIKGVKNPRFARLHAVRYDEVGCGFDEDNCLSLLVTELESGERQTKLLYVQRTDAAAEKEAEAHNVVERVKEEGGNQDVR